MSAWRGWTIWLLLSLALHAFVLGGSTSVLGWRDATNPAPGSFSTRVIADAPSAVTAHAPLAPHRPAQQAGPTPAAALPPIPEEKTPPRPMDTALNATPSVAPEAPTPSLAPPAKIEPAHLSNSDADVQQASSQPLSKSASQPLQVSLPANAELTYNATQMRAGQPRSGAGVLTWRSDGSSYNLRIAWKIGFITLFEQSSVGQVSAQGLSPERFADKRINRSEQATHFQAPGQEPGGRIIFSRNRPTTAWLEGVQDRLSVIMQLAGLLQGQLQTAQPNADTVSARYQNSSALSIPVAGLDAVDLWKWQIGEIETVTLASGSVQALRLTREPRGEYDQRVQIWFAPSLNHWPVRILRSSPAAPEAEYEELVLRQVP